MHSSCKPNPIMIPKSSTDHSLINSSGISLYVEHLFLKLHLSRDQLPCSQQQQGCQRQRHGLYKVLPNLRLANSCDYEPVFFFFGLYNAAARSTDCSAAPCDHYKIQIAQSLTSERSFEELLRAIVDRAEDIKHLYSIGGGIDHLLEGEGARNIALLLALDALTVVAAACYQDCVVPQSMCLVISRDALLLEQQLPLFVLQAALDSIDELVNEECSSRSSSSSSCRAASASDSDGGSTGDTLHLIVRCRPQIQDVVTFYALQTSYPFMRNVPALRERFRSPIPPVIMHQSMLSYIHCTLSQNYTPLHNTQSLQSHVVTTQFASLPTASKLQAYGIRFSVGDGGFTGISFDKKARLLTLPEMTVFNTSKSYLLNLVAHEVAASRYDDPCYVSSFLLLMASLVHAERDVEVLVDAQVLHNHMGSHAQLAEMWTSLVVNVPINMTHSDNEVIIDVRGMMCARSVQMRRFAAAAGRAVKQRKYKRRWLFAEPFSAVLAAAADLRRKIFQSVLN